MILILLSGLNMVCNGQNNIKQDSVNNELLNICFELSSISLTQQQHIDFNSAEINYNRAEIARINRNISLAGQYQEKAGECYNNALIFAGIGTAIGVLTGVIYAYGKADELSHPNSLPTSFYKEFTYIGAISAVSLDIVGLVQLIRGNNYLRKTGQAQYDNKPYRLGD